MSAASGYKWGGTIQKLLFYYVWIARLIFFKSLKGALRAGYPELYERYTLK
jgi:hypothetical protein